MSQVVGLPNNSYKPITNSTWVRARLCKLQKGCTRLAAASDKAYQLLVHGRWFSPGTPASSITKTGRHYIAEILLKVALNTKNQIKSIISQFWSIVINKRSVLGTERRSDKKKKRFTSIVFKYNSKNSIQNHYANRT